MDGSLRDYVETIVMLRVTCAFCGREEEFVSELPCVEAECDKVIKILLDEGWAEREADSVVGIACLYCVENIDRENGL